jgi:hypothetical protein
VEAPVQDLVDAARAALPRWLVQCVVQTARRRGVSLDGEVMRAIAADAEAMSETATPIVLAELHALLATDVDAQQTNPLSVLRAATRFPTEVLARHGVPHERRDDFAARAFPDDVYGLSPATWADVDESLAEPGLVWGAWKAMTVLGRRRAEGRLPPRRVSDSDSG